MKIRPAVEEDSELLFGLIRELAEYEKLAGEIRGDAELLARTLFGRDGAEALIAEVDGGAVGYALFFATYSTFECRPGIWVEDLFVQPEHRRRGIGRALLARIAATALERGCARLEWSALDWNEPALRFYDELGAKRLGEWLTLRLDGQELERLGAEPGDASPRP